ncbi:hypothetical protein ABZ897_55550 [Nonomuraea sp. NPDC046802]|uniref:hypothetical protein n=1 Tax=Nonomuraea sp. NPDC046802 TaxID=3154919 RepID=UPI0033EC4D12
MLVADGATFAMADVLATVISWTAICRDCLAALLTASEIVADPGPGDDEPVTGAVAAVTRAGQDTVVGWCGDSCTYWSRVAVR